MFYNHLIQVFLVYINFYSKVKVFVISYYRKWIHNSIFRKSKSLSELNGNVNIRLLYKYSIPLWFINGTHSTNKWRVLFKNWYRSSFRMWDWNCLKSGSQCSPFNSINYVSNINETYQNVYIIKYQISNEVYILFWISILNPFIISTNMIN